MPRPYFSPATMRFLRALQKNNNREWFHAHKGDYETHVREPFLDLIADLAEPLARISPHYRAEPGKVGGSLFRIHRDLRYANNKMPYKYWAGARLGHERRREVAAPSFYIHIQPGHSFLGGGLWHPESHTLRSIRDFIVDNPVGWKAATRRPVFRRHLRWAGDSLKRPPRGFDPAHELIADLKRKSFAAIEPISDDDACSEHLKRRIVTQMKRVAPLVDYLCAAQDLEF